MKRVYLAATAMAVAMTGCSLPPTLNGDVSPDYRPSFLRYQGTQGPIAVAIHNDPFGAAADPAVAASLGRTAPGHLGRVSFTASQPPTPYRVVLAFNPAERTDPRRLCADPSAAGAAQAQKLRAQAVLCAGGNWLTSVWAVDANLDVVSGAKAAVKSPDDPAFDHFMGEILAELLPNKNVFTENCRC